MGTDFVLHLFGGHNSLHILHKDAMDVRMFKCKKLQALIKKKNPSNIVSKDLSIIYPKLLEMGW